MREQITLIRTNNPNESIRWEEISRLLIESFNKNEMPWPIREINELTKSFFSSISHKNTTKQIVRKSKNHLKQVLSLNKVQVKECEKIIHSYIKDLKKEYIKKESLINNNEKAKDVLLDFIDNYHFQDKNWWYNTIYAYLIEKYGESEWIVKKNLIHNYLIPLSQERIIDLLGETYNKKNITFEKEIRRSSTDYKNEWKNFFRYLEDKSIKAWNIATLKERKTSENDWNRLYISFFYQHWSNRPDILYSKDFFYGYEKIYPLNRKVDNTLDDIKIKLWEFEQFIETNQVRRRWPAYLKKYDSVLYRRLRLHYRNTTDEVDWLYILIYLIKRENTMKLFRHKDNPIVSSKIKDKQWYQWDFSNITNIKANNDLNPEELYIKDEEYMLFQNYIDWLLDQEQKIIELFYKWDIEISDHNLQEIIKKCKKNLNFN